jgi:hypothetical protein
MVAVEELGQQMQQGHGNIFCCWTHPLTLLYLYMVTLAKILGGCGKAASSF